MAGNMNIHRGIPTGFSTEQPKQIQDQPRLGFFGKLGVKMGVKLDPAKTKAAQQRNPIDGFKKNPFDTVSKAGLTNLQRGRGHTVSSPLTDEALLQDLDAIT